MPQAGKKDFMFGIDDLGKSFAQLQAQYNIKPPLAGFNQARHLSIFNEIYWFGELPFEVVFVFDQPGQEGHLLAVENICRLPDTNPEQLEQFVASLTRMWGPAQTSPSQWVWSTQEFMASLTLPEVESGSSWVLEIHRNISAPMPASQPLSTLGGWGRAIWGNTLASLREIYSLGEVERSKLNNKPVALMQNEVTYFNHPFNASFFFDRFTAQANLVGIDLYLLQDQEQDHWLTERDNMIAGLSKLYGQPKIHHDEHRSTWEWRDGEGSLTLTDASKGPRTTWMLSFRPPPGRVAPTPALSAPRSPYDIAGWGGSRFGMSTAQVELLYVGHSPALQRLAGSGYGFESVLRLDEMDFKVLFLFDRDKQPPRLTQVVLTRTAPEGQDEEKTNAQLKDLLKLLTAWYGAPTQDLLNSKSGGKVIWKRASGSLEFHNLLHISTWVLNFRVN